LAKMHLAKVSLSE